MSVSDFIGKEGNIMTLRFRIMFAFTVLVGASAHADWVLEEHTLPEGTYVRGIHYDFTIQYGVPYITILLPSLPNKPYWFDCHDTEAPYDPAPIGEIFAGDSVGTVEIMVADHEMGSGASDVWLIQIHQTSGGGALVELKISGNYGDPADPEHGGPLVADSADVIDIGGNLVKPAVIATEAAPADLTSFSVTGDLLPQATVTIYGDTTTFEVAGDILMAASYCPQIAQIEQIQRNAHGSLRNVRNLWSLAFETRC
jgi:hypothetical protein